jgi:hypothetical protein
MMHASTTFALVLLLLASFQCSTIMAFSKPPPLALTLSFLRPPVAFRKSAKTDEIMTSSQPQLRQPSEEQQQLQPQRRPQDQSLEDFNAMCQQMISDHRREAQLSYGYLPVREREFGNVY